VTSRFVTSRWVRAAQYTGVKQYWTYMLRCRDGSYYVGVTSELEIRLAKHALGIDERAYTFRRRPVKLVHAEVFSTPDEAIHAEKRIKGWSRAKKEALVRADWKAIHELARSSPRRKRPADPEREGPVPERDCGAPFDKLRVTRGPLVAPDDPA
jgi:predicted GIY-YIG superfamily endonuclease